MEFQQIRDRLVLAALPHVVFDGWSTKALTQAARDEGLDPTLAERAFLGGPVDAVEHFSDLADRMMAEDLALVDMTTLRVPDRVYLAIEARLKRWAPHREAVRRAMAVLALPPHGTVAMQITFRTVDAIWHLAGDSSNDFSWYTRRATLAAVFSATVLCWLDDESEDGADTWAFLRRRLADVGRITSTRKRVAAWLKTLPKPGRVFAR
ncbi:MAG: COQ9 family protein [Rhodospirillaceae bacterium]|nr:COQ9 family protein [Rhodospirillales bacterium]